MQIVTVGILIRPCTSVINIDIIAIKNPATAKLLKKSPLLPDILAWPKNVPIKVILKIANKSIGINAGTTAAGYVNSPARPV